MTRTLRQHIEALSQWSRDDLRFSPFSDALTQQLATEFGASPETVRKLLREADREAVLSGQGILRAWHEAVLIHPGMTSTEKVAGLRVWCFVNHAHRYAWPSQDRLAKELGYSRGPNLGKALRKTFELGAYSPVKIKDLPAEVRKLAVDGSHRSLRGIAYRLNPVDRWSEEAAIFASLQDSNMFHGGTLEGSVLHHLNYEGNHQRAALNSFAHAQGVPSLTSPPVETSHWGTDGGRSHG